MITEDYVSFETAKLLKEKGFDEPTTKSYYTEGFEIPMKFSHDLLPCIKTNEFLCPTHQMVLKWLREVHKYFIGIGFKKGSYLFIIKDIKKKLEIGISDKEFITYEEACEAAIEYCLINLIK